MTRRRVTPARGVPAARTGSYTWPRYLVTAPHMQVPPLADRDERVPHGQWHAREAGNNRTACGLPAVDWHFFWTLRFDRAGARGCPGCIEVLARSDLRGR
jgi:hypothetical protein